MNRERADALLDLVERMVAEMRGAAPGSVAVRLEDALDRDLGFDSLGRVELVKRIEGEFRVRLGEGVLSRAEKVADLLAAIDHAGPARTPGTERRARLEAEGEVEVPPDAIATLVDALEWHVQRHPDRVHLHLYEDPDRATDVTYSELYRDARRVAASLGEMGLEPGGAVALLLPTGRSYFHAFYGTLLAGGVPVPLYPPVRLSQLEEHLAKQARILENAGVSILVTFPEARNVARALRLRVRGLRHVVAAEDLLGSEAEPVRVALGPDDVAFLQYTSGSTGDPKGVVLTHANLLANIRAMGRALEAGPRDVLVSWLPLYHDMGLIGACLSTMYFAIPVALLSPIAFLTRPERWLWTIHRHGGTISAAPNFAYELCATRIDEEAVRGLDLSTWRAALNGAEPVSPRTIERFQERFGPHGFRKETMCPVYGLAESAVGLTFPRPWNVGPIVDRIRRDEFARTGRAVAAGADGEDGLVFVGCGQPLPGHEVRIVDETGREVGDRQQGRLQFRGPSSCRGYYRNEDATRRLRRGEWLDSGDRAYTVAGDVFLTGREKDIIIRGGRNIYPHEVEEAVGEIPGVRRGCVAVFGSPDPGTGTERLVVLAETRLSEPDRRDELRRRIQLAACDVLGAPPDAVVLAAPRLVPKTSSGKIRRSAARELYERGALEQRPPSPAWQVASLLWASLRDRFRVGRRVAGEFGYAIRVWLSFLVVAVPGWAAVLLFPRLAWRWAFVRAGGRLMLRLARIPVRVEGLERIPPGRQAVLVANHASYLDPLVLIAAVPGRYAFVAKRELEASFASRAFLSRIGVQFVERFQAQEAAQDARRVLEVAGSGTSLAVFPEGTFLRRPGLLPFRTGAFAIAAEAGLPVVPVAIHGTRSVLRGDEWFPRRGEIRIVVLDPIEPDGADWSAAVRLRDRAREAILAACGEPDLSREPVLV